MSVGLIALLDDLAAIAKVAAASLDDIASQAAKAGVKAAGVVIDDAAVTPGYVIGFAAKRELPIVGRIAAGSLRNKILILLPVAQALSYFLPWMITPLLMIGGGYLGYEGVEKVIEAAMPHRAQPIEGGPYTSRPSSRLISNSTPSGGAPLATCEEAIDNEDDNCADHATNDASRISGPIPPDSLPEVSCNERAYDSQDCR